MKETEQILIVSSDDKWSKTVSTILYDKGFPTYIVRSMQDAINRLDAKYYYVAVVDLALNQEKIDRKDAIDVIKHIWELNENTRFIVVSQAFDLESISNYGFINEIGLEISEKEIGENLAKLIDSIENSYVQVRNEVARRIWDETPSGFLSGVSVREIQSTMGGGSVQELREFLRELCGPFAPWLQAKIRPVAIRNGEQFVGFQTLFWSRALGEAVLTLFGRKDQFTASLGKDQSFQAPFGKVREKVREHSSIHFTGSVFKLADVDFSENFKRPTLRRYEYPGIVPGGTVTRSSQEQSIQNAVLTIRDDIIKAAFDLNDVCSIILEESLRLAETEFGEVLIVDSTDQGRKLLRIYSTTLDAGMGILLEIDDSVCGFVVKTKRTIRVSDVRNEEPFRSLYKPTLSGDLRSELAVPITVDSEVIGVINVESTKVGAFNAQHEEWLGKLSAQVGAPLRLAIAVGELQILKDFQNKILTEKRTLRETAKEILNYVCQLIYSETGQVLIRDKNQLTVIASTNEDEIGKQISINDTVSGLSIVQDQIIIVDDFSTEEPYKTLYRISKNKNIHSEIAIPLKIGNEIIGVLNAESPRVKAFTADNTGFLLTLVGQAAMALRLAEQLELRERANEADKTLSAGQIVHRLTGRAGAIRGWIEIIREITQEKAPKLIVDETFSTALNDIDAKASNILELVAEFKKRASEPASVIDLLDLINKAIAKANIPDNIELVLSVEPDIPRIRSDVALGEVFWNLITNAVQVMPDGGTIFINAKAMDDKKKIKIEFQDTGPGIPSSLHNVIFDSSFTTKQQGHGLGLFWSRAFIKAIGGEIMLESETGKGASFIIYLPAIKSF